MTGYKIKIRLDDFRPLTWRDLIIPAGITFHDLHEVIQTVMDLNDYHLYAFTIKNTNFRIVNFDICDVYGEEFDSNITYVDDFFYK